MEHPECRPRQKSLDKLDRSLENLRNRLLAKGKISFSRTTETSMFQSHSIPMVYAGLGTPEKGATVSEIQKRTGFDKNTISSSLYILLREDLVEKRGDHYLGKSGHLNFAHMKENEIFQNFFLYLLSQASASARTNFNSDKHLFFTSTFSVEERDLKQLKEDLRSVLLKYVDQSENPQGDKIMSMACSLF